MNQLRIIRPNQLLLCENKIETDISTGKKKYFVYGPALVSEERNKNDRIYPKWILSREVKRYDEEYIKTKTAYGEFGHPDRLKIDPLLISHLTISLIEDGNRWIGKHVIIPNPSGLACQNIIEYGGRIGNSSRGAGSLDEGKSISTVCEDYFMVCLDLVTDPSGPGCMLDAMMEGKEFRTKTGKIYDNGRIIDITKKTNMRNLREASNRMWDKFWTEFNDCVTK